MKKCKKCLLLEAGENKSYNTIKEYLDNIDPTLKTDIKNYKLRLEKCKKCDFLISGMCLKCGCYVEVRAAFNDKHCVIITIKINLQINIIKIRLIKISLQRISTTFLLNQTTQSLAETVIGRE